MGLTGNLSTMSLSEIFQWLSIGQKTGTLLVEGTGVSKEVYFQEGRISSASSNDPRELMGQFLINSKKLTERQLKVALEMQARDQAMLGDILLQQNILTHDELFQILKNASEEVVYDLFLWEEGKFEFFDDKLPKRKMMKFDFDITHIILEGVRRTDEWGLVREVFPNGDTVLRPNIEVIALHLPLHQNEERMLRLVNGDRTIEEITKKLRSSLFNVCQGLLALYQAKLIEVNTFKENLLPSEVKEKRDPVQSLGDNIRKLLDHGRIDDAESLLIDMERKAPQDPSTKVLRDQCREKRMETTAKRMIKPSAIPKLAMEVDKITELPLTPEEGFVVSRINGLWDVQSIVKIAPFDENVSLKIFKKFLDDKVIEFK